MGESNTVAPENTLEVDPPPPLRELESLLQKEKADFAAVDARRGDFAKRIDEEARRPVLIRQRLNELKEQQDEIAAQLKLTPLANEGSATAEARRWVQETGYEALSAEIKMLDQELLSQPARVDLLKPGDALAGVRPPSAGAGYPAVEPKAPDRVRRNPERQARRAHD